MRIFHDLSQIQGRIPNPAVTVGSFDGVHAGHRAILNRLGQAVVRNGGESVVITFHPHPRQVLHPEDGSLKLLNSLEEKIYLLEQAGVDNLLVIAFTPAFSRLDSEEFARLYLLEGIGAKTIVMGYNHHFGYHRQGNRDYLDGLKKEYDFDVYQVPRQDVSEQKVSSTVIRSLIAGGELKAARELLTQPYFFIAKKGEEGLLEYDETHKLFPPEGIYPVEMHSGGRTANSELTILPGNGLDMCIPEKCRIRPGDKLTVIFTHSPEAD